MTVPYYDAVTTKKIIAKLNRIRAIVDSIPDDDMSPIYTDCNHIAASTDNALMALSR